MLTRRNFFKLANRLSLCLQKEESADHLFVHCRSNSMLWHLSFSLIIRFIGCTLEQERHASRAWSWNLEDTCIGHLVKCVCVGYGYVLSRTQAYFSELHIAWVKFSILVQSCLCWISYWSVIQESLKACLSLFYAGDMPIGVLRTQT